MTVWYIRDGSSIGWSNVTAWSTGATIAAGALRRQSATPTNGNERVFVAIVAGTTHATTEPTWTVTKGAKTTDNTVTWQECTGQPAVNGNLTDTPLSSTVRSVAQSLGKIIKDNAGTHIFICSTAGTPGGSEPSYSTGAVGNTTADGSATWTYIGTSFSSWAAPHARLNNAHAANWGAAGDTFLAGSDHAETQAAALTLALAGSYASPTFHYSIDVAGSVVSASATLLAGASITTTGNSSISINGTSVSSTFNGMTFNCGTGSSAALTVAGSAGMRLKFENCALKKLGTSGTGTAITVGANAASSDYVELVNTTLSFGSASDSIRFLCSRLLWRNTASAIGGTTPTTLISSATGKSGGNIVFEGVDLSALGSGKKLVTTAASDAATISLLDCKLGSSVTVADTPTAPLGTTVDLIRCDSGATTYRQERYWYEGTLTPETTIVRTGGATDGTTPLAWKIVTTANSKWALPFECFPIDIWNSTTGSSVTVTVYGIWGGGAVPNNDDIWIDVEYLGNASYPLASVATSTKANGLATASALSSDSSTWGGSTTKFKMTATFTPQLAGYLRIYLRAAALSSTFYIDPKPVLS